MPFDETTRQSVLTYITKCLGSEEWHRDYFDFIEDNDIAQRLSEEFLSIRYVYKFFEGIRADGWLRREQIRIQIISYASIYEAVLHYILFVVLKDNENVKSLKEFSTKKEISIPNDALIKIEEYLVHDGKKIIPTYETKGKIPETKVRFDRKAECAHSLGIIDEKLKNDLVEIYGVRNSIHIDAEIRKGIDYELELSRKAYRRLKPFKEQIIEWKKLNSITL